MESLYKTGQTDTKRAQSCPLCTFNSQGVDMFFKLFTWKVSKMLNQE